MTVVKICALSLIAAVAAAPTPAARRVALPDGRAGIGFDDLRYSARLHRLLVPGGRSGNLTLIDPDTLAITTVAGFGAVSRYAGGHDDGPTSVDEGNGLLYVTDRTKRLLDVVDPAAGRIVAATALAAGPDYVRYVAATNELWVTEPDADQIEIFTLPPGRTAAPVHAAVVPVKNGPESLVIDEKRGRAYTHRWEATTVAVDLRARRIVAEWKNGCAAARGIALDGARGFLIAACGEGTTAVLDVNHDGRILSTLARGSGFDVIGYAPGTGRLFLAGSRCHCLVTLVLGADGTLTFVGQRQTARGAHCATADDAGHAWWCDPDQGSLWRVADTPPPGGPPDGDAGRQ